MRIMLHAWAHMAWLQWWQLASCFHCSSLLWLLWLMCFIAVDELLYHLIWLLSLDAEGGSDTMLDTCR